MSLELTLSFDSLSRVDGSARFGFGAYPQFLTSVSGPIEARLAAEQPSRCTIEVHVRPLANVPGTESKKAAVILKEVLQREVIMEANPRTLVQFVVQALVPTLKGSDELVASMINGCTLSLLNAGSVPMRGVICAVSVGRISSDSDSSYVVRPSEDQLSRTDAGGCFAFMFSDSLDLKAPYTSSCVWTNWRALRTVPDVAVDGEALVEARDTARDAAREVWERMKTLVEEKENPVAKATKKAVKEEVKMEVEHEDDDAKMEI